MVYTLPHYLDIEVSLLAIEPRIWRRFLIRSSSTFADLHVAIQDAFGWNNAHLFEFRTETDWDGHVIAGATEDGDCDPFEEDIPDAYGVKLSTFFQAPGAGCIYVYDFGDNWQHHVELRHILFHPRDFRRRLLQGRRACPPEDCGGVNGYEDIAAVLGCGRDTAEDAGPRGAWHPESFDLEGRKKRFDR